MRVQQRDILRVKSFKIEFFFFFLFPELQRQEESAKLLEDKVRRAEAEARELELKRLQAEEEKKKMEQQTNEQAKDNLLMVNLMHHVKSRNFTFCPCNRP